jgi:menaquinone-dependent protoporphyrinogen oxidase
MQRIGIFYATREGHTRRIAEHAAADFRARGFESEILNLADPEARAKDLNNYSAVVVAASVHAGRHEREAVEFVRERRAELESVPAAFISVTLSEAGVERSDATNEERARFTADVRKVTEAFFEETGGRPARVKPVAGALLYTKYNFLVRYIMKRIARKAGAATDTSRDYEYTDWVALDRFVNELADEIASGPGKAGQPERG